MAEETNNQIIALQAKHEEEKGRFETEIQKLQLKLKEKDDIIGLEQNSANFYKTLKDN